MLDRYGKLTLGSVRLHCHCTASLRRDADDVQNATLLALSAHNFRSSRTIYFSLVMVIASCFSHHKPRCLVLFWIAITTHTFGLFVWGRVVIHISHHAYGKIVKMDILCTLSVSAYSSACVCMCLYNLYACLGFFCPPKTFGFFRPKDEHETKVQNVSTLKLTKGGKSIRSFGQALAEVIWNVLEKKGATEVHLPTDAE